MINSAYSTEIEEQMQELYKRLPEKSRCLYAGVEALKLGYGWVKTHLPPNQRLQSRLDVHWILHNFVCKHFTTKEVPAVALGVLKKAFSVVELFKIQIATPRA